MATMSSSPDQCATDTTTLGAEENATPSPQSQSVPDSPQVNNVNDCDKHEDDRLVAANDIFNELRAAHKLERGLDDKTLLKKRKEAKRKLLTKRERTAIKDLCTSAGYVKDVVTYIGTIYDEHEKAKAKAMKAAALASAKKVATGTYMPSVPKTPSTHGGMMA